MPSATYVVNLPGDAGTGTATAGDIRYCVTHANANPNSTIVFDTAHSGSLIPLSHGELALTANMRIIGPGAASLNISGSSGATSSRVFDITSSSAQVLIQGVAISGGIASPTPSATPGNQGGDILNLGTLVLIGDVVAGGTAAGAAGTSGTPNGGSARGGGIFNSTGAVLYIDSTGVGMNAAVGGAGFNPASGGQNGGNGGQALGGGVYNVGATLILQNSSNMANNGALGGAGGAGTAATVAGSAGGAGGLAGRAQGGGVFNLGALSLSSTPFTANIALGGSGGSGGNGAAGAAGASGGNGGAGGWGGEAGGGGLASFSSQAVPITASPFNTNLAQGGAAGDGGAGAAGGANNSGIGGNGGFAGNGGQSFPAQGGGILEGEGALSISGGGFSSNTARAGSGGNGGAGGAGGTGTTSDGTASMGGTGGRSRSALGGGIAVTSGNLTLVSSSLTLNVAQGGAGGLGGHGGNAGNGGAGGLGGAGGNAEGGGSVAFISVVTVTGSAVHSNFAEAGSGGMGGEAGGQSLSGPNISGTGGAGGSAYGGGIASSGIGSSFFLNSSDVSGNGAVSGNGGAGGFGIGAVIEGIGGTGGSVGTNRGAGIYLSNQHATISGSQVTANVGVGGRGGAGGMGGEGDFFGSPFGPGGNGGTGGSAVGGGICFDNRLGTTNPATLTITASQVSSNTLYGGTGGSGGIGGGGNGIGGPGGTAGKALGGGLGLLDTSTTSPNAVMVQLSNLLGNQLFGGVGGAGGIGSMGGNAGNGGSALGGGLYNSSTNSAHVSAVQVSYSTLAANVALGASGGTGGGAAVAGSGSNGGNGGSAGNGEGGGLFNGNNTLLGMLNSTVGGPGAGNIVGGSNGGTGGISQSAMSHSGNGGTGGLAVGGGLYISSGTAQLQSVTIAANQATVSGAGGSPGAVFNGATLGTSGLAGLGAGGGYFGASPSGTNALINTIIALDSASQDKDVVGIFTSQGHNIVGDTTGSSGFGASGDIVNFNPALLQLQALANNGGATLTDALGAGSIAINAGDNAGVPITDFYDQRGPGFQRIAHLFVDIGAFEVQ